MVLGTPDLIRKKENTGKIWVNIGGTPLAHEFSKLILMVEAKIITQSDMILSIERKYLKLPEGQENVMGGKVSILH